MIQSATTFHLPPVGFHAGRIAIIEAEPYARSSLNRWLVEDPRYEVVFNASHLPSTFDELTKRETEIVLLSWPLLENISLKTALLYVEAWVKQKILVMVLVDQANNAERELFFRAGISTYCLKEVNIDTLAELIDINIARKMQSQGYHLDPVKELYSHMPVPKPTGESPLQRLENEFGVREDEFEWGELSCLN